MSVISVSAEDTSGLTFVIDTGAELTLTDADADGYYDIGTADELYAFAYAVNGGNTSINAELTADIVVNEGTMSAETDRTSVRHWTTIGNSSNMYTGIFNGNNHTVSGVYFNKTEISYVGLFGYIGENSTVENTGVINSYFNGDRYIGGVAGFNCKGTIEKSYNTGDVSGCYDVGGVAGYSNDTVTNSYNTGAVSGDDHVGGVVGDNYYGTITNCYYLSDSETDSFDDTTAKTKEQFESGEVAYLLQDGVTADKNGDIPHIWGQDITTGEDDTTVDATPTLGGEKVYYGYKDCHATEMTYCNNAYDEIPTHGFENGFCTICNDYEPATLNADGCYEIGNAGQFYWFADKVNNDNDNFGSANAILTADVVVNEGTMSAKTENAREWTPIGNNTKKYTGTFNGNKHTVSGLYFDTNTNKVKVFNAPIDTTKVKVAFDSIDALVLTSADGVTFKGTVALEAGTYTFRMDEFGTPMGGKYSFTDNSNSMTYNATYASATTMTATGGEYTFTYNVNTNALKVTKV